MDYQKIQTTFYEMLYEIRRDDPDDLFSNRKFVIGFVLSFLGAQLLQFWIPEYIALALALISVVILGYCIRRPQMSFVRYMLQTLILAGALIGIWLGLSFLVKRLVL